VTAIRNPMPEEQPVISTTFCPLFAMIRSGRRCVFQRSSAPDGRLAAAGATDHRTFKKLKRIMKPLRPCERPDQSHVHVERNLEPKTT
ncbi:hypothetical protein XENOCAPTIV_011349, partial [Xenoophorus captivus]